MVVKMSKTKSTLYPETIDSTKIGVYNKIGFHTIDMDRQKLFCMNRMR